MDTNKIALKVKIKSLAEEARIIRKEELKAKKKDEQLFHSLRIHRTIDVRNEARHSLLAYGFLRGRPYSSMEQKVSEAPNWVRVEKLVEKFGRCRDWENGESWTDHDKSKSDEKLRFNKWLKDAKNSLSLKEPSA